MKTIDGMTDGQIIAIDGSLTAPNLCLEASNNHSGSVLDLEKLSEDDSFDFMQYYSNVINNYFQNDFSNTCNEGEYSFDDVIVILYKYRTTQLRFFGGLYDTYQRLIQSGELMTDGEKLHFTRHDSEQSDAISVPLNKCLYQGDCPSLELRESAGLLLSTVFQSNNKPLCDYVLKMANFFQTKESIDEGLENLKDFTSPEKQDLTDDMKYQQQKCKERLVEDCKHICDVMNELYLEENNEYVYAYQKYKVFSEFF